MDETGHTMLLWGSESVADQCPRCHAKACGFRKINENDFEGFCMKCGSTWPEPGKATVASSAGPFELSPEPSPED